MEESLVNYSYTVKPEAEINKMLRQAEHSFPIINDEQQLFEQADFYKALADPVRLKIIAILLEAPCCLCELASAFKIPNSTLTHHLKLLERGRVIVAKKIGRYTIYELTDENAANFLS